MAVAEASAAGVPVVGFASCGVLESAGAGTSEMVGAAATNSNVLVEWPPSALALAEATERVLKKKVCAGGPR